MNLVSLTEEIKTAEEGLKAKGDNDPIYLSNLKKVREFKAGRKVVSTLTQIHEEFDERLVITMAFLFFSPINFNRIFNEVDDSAHTHIFVPKEHDDDIEEEKGGEVSKEAGEGGQLGCNTDIIDAVSKSFDKWLNSPDGQHIISDLGATTVGSTVFNQGSGVRGIDLRCTIKNTYLFAFYFYFLTHTKLTGDIKCKEIGFVTFMHSLQIVLRTLISGENLRVLFKKMMYAKIEDENWGEKEQGTDGANK